MTTALFKNTAESGFSTAGALIVTDQDGKLPPIDGSNLLNVTVNSVTNSPASLTHQGAFGTVVTVNMARNSIYAVSSSGPNFTITSALRTSYQNGDLIYIHMHTGTWCSLVNSDTAGGTKLFVKGVETTNWRFNTARGIIKLRLTTHTDGNLYIHTADDMAILEDFKDVTGTNSSITIGSVLRYNPSTQKWSPKLAWLPKTIVITNDNAHLYVTGLQADIGGSIPTVNMRGSTTQTIGDPIYGSGWDNLLDNEYDSYVVIWKATAMTYANVTLNSNGFKIFLPSIADGWVGKKITVLVDAIHARNAAVWASVLASDAAGNVDVMDGRDNNNSVFLSNKNASGPRSSISLNTPNNLTPNGVVLIAADTTVIAATQKPGADAANYPTVWFRVPF
jgi:hypothetical protein